MQCPCICSWKSLRSSHIQDTTFFTHRHSVSPSFFSVRCSFSWSSGRNSSRGEKLKAGGKENVWIVDNDAANSDREKKGRGKRGVRKVKKDSKGDKVMISGTMLMEVKTVLQTQEPVIRPAWNTFASSVSGIWKGVGAVFSPITAKMEPLDIGSNNEKLFDFYTLAHIEPVIPSLPESQTSQINRKISCLTFVSQIDDSTP